MGALRASLAGEGASLLSGEEGAGSILGRAWGLEEAGAADSDAAASEDGQLQSLALPCLPFPPFAVLKCFSLTLSNFRNVLAGPAISFRLGSLWRQDGGLAELRGINTKVPEGRLRRSA